MPLSGPDLVWGGGWEENAEECRDNFLFKSNQD